MGSNRVLKLTNNGELQAFEDSSNGTSKVTLKAPASLAGEVTFQLPGTNGSNGQFLKTNGSGVLSWDNGTSTLQSAYDVGQSITEAGGNGISIIGTTADALTISQANSAGVNLKLTNTTSSHALSIDVSGGSGLQISGQSFSVANNGDLNLSGSSATITFGGDVTLYRSAADKLKTDDDVVIADGKNLEWSDVNLYRDSANNLKTDDDFTALGGYRQILDGWYYEDLPTDSSGQCNRWSADIHADRRNSILPHGGSITGIAIRSTVSVSSGTVTAYARINGTPVFSVTLSSGVANVATQAKDTDTFDAGVNYIDVSWATDASWTHTTADISVVLEIET